NARQVELNAAPDNESGRGIGWKSSEESTDVCTIYKESSRKRKGRQGHEYELTNPHGGFAAVRGEHLRRLAARPCGRARHRSRPGAGVDPRPAPRRATHARDHPQHARARRSPRGERGPETDLSPGAAPDRRERGAAP